MQPAEIIDVHPDISVIIAAYNAESTISRAIRSALEQDGVSVEIIVVDDKSSDNTVDVVRSFSQTNIRVLQLDVNGGPARARNVAIDAARGRWIAVLDADDEMFPGRLLALTSRAESTGAMLVVDNIEVIDNRDGNTYQMFPAARLKQVEKLTLPIFIASNLVFSSTFNYGYMKPVFSREFVLRHGLRYSENLRIGEDYLFFASMLASGGECVVEPTTGYSYHVNDGSISRTLKFHHVASMIEADAVFLARFELDLEAKAAQARRTRNLEEVQNFLSLVEYIKCGSVRNIIRMALVDPMAFRFLHMPVAVRIKRLMPNFMSRNPFPKHGRTKQHSRV
ncbi:glycosyltransferase family 2 protein [Phyllobacterium zundukense]|uniref:glycosyltransferase family 2 protein n=1 Tax=Phyllobacterium zundukense TaxID=1867719 RepID=UPI001F18C4A0|nr:glycosyltransferase family 2 protein [Phyllobacterium zundukense]